MNIQKNHHSGERLFSLTEGGAVVHRDKSGKVSPDWLCACEQERNLTRSEEHTSELQSHSEISYAVFCLKKKNSRAEK